LAGTGIVEEEVFAPERNLEQTRRGKESWGSQKNTGKTESREGIVRKEQIHSTEDLVVERGRVEVSHEGNGGT